MASGDPFTTIENTIASILYRFFDLETAGIYEPWLPMQRLKASVNANGDDN
jgi:hypothetical protein